MNCKKILDKITNSIVIGPSEYRTLFLMLKNQNPLSNFSYITKETFLEEIYGKYNENAIKTLMDKEQISFSIATSILKYISHGYYDDKYSFLDNKLIYKDEYSIYNYKNNKITVFGYGENDPELINVFIKLSIKDVKFVSLFDLDLEKNNKKVYKFEDKYEEIRYVLNDILFKVSEGSKKLSQFVIFADLSNYFIIDKFSKLYGVPVNFKVNKTLLDTKSAKKILKCKLEDLYGFINDEKNFCDDLENYRKIFKLYKFYELKIDNFFYSNLISILENENLLEDTYDDAIIVTNRINFNTNNIYYIIGAIDGFIPSIKKDNDYFSDLIKSKNDLCTSKDYNLLSNKIFEQFVTYKNVEFISYPLENGKNEISFFLKQLGFIEILPEQNLKQFSLKINELYYRHYLMKNETFKEDKNEFRNLKESLIYSSIFNNEFNGIKGVKKDKLIHSYSSIEMYAECPFKYYLNKILCLKPFEESEAALIGNVEHKILEKIYDEDFNFESIEAECVKGFNNKCLMLWQRCRDDLKSCIDFIKSKELKNPFKNTYNEKEITVNFDNFSIYGKIDRIFTYDNCFVVVDYKSGKSLFNVDLTNLYGLYMQLPTYLLLIQNSPEFKELKPIGSFIQPTTIKSFTNYLNKDDKYYSNFMLDGISTNNIELMRKFDSSFDFAIDGKSKYIINLSIKNECIASKSNILGDEKFEELKNNCYKWYSYFDENIKNNIFNISPALTSKNDACKFCDFKDVCYVKKSQIRNLKKVGK